MKYYPPDLLDVWADDIISTRLDTSSETVKHFPGFYATVSGEFNWLKSSVRETEQSEDEEIFEKLYRRGHVICGFAAIFEIPKVCHLLAILDFVFDYARNIQTLRNHSLDYLANLR